MVFARGTFNLLIKERPKSKKALPGFGKAESKHLREKRSASRVRHGVDFAELVNRDVGVNLRGR